MIVNHHYDSNRTNEVISGIITVINDSSVNHSYMIPMKPIKTISLVS